MIDNTYLITFIIDVPVAMLVARVLSTAVLGGLIAITIPHRHNLKSTIEVLEGAKRRTKERENAIVHLR